MELESETTLQILVQVLLHFTFPDVVISRFEERSEVPKVEDIWIPKAFAFLDCFINVFILGIKNFLQEGNMIFRVEARGNMFRLISWKLYLKSNQGFKWQLKGCK
jgi:hypothetical protein